MKVPEAVGGLVPQPEPPCDSPLPPSPCVLLRFDIVACVRAVICRETARSLALGAAPLHGAAARCTRRAADVLCTSSCGIPHALLLAFLQPLQARP